MKIVMTIAAAACAFALTACGGGDSSRADEGIWSSLSLDSYSGMQAVILDDGSYWGIYGTVGGDNGSFEPDMIMHGTASVSGSNISGAYTIFYAQDGTYFGTVFPRNKLNLVLQTKTGVQIATANMDYDSIYNQPASLPLIAGNYLNQSRGGYTTSLPINPNIHYIYPNPSIFGSNLALVDQNGNLVMTGIVTPHGTTVNVFDVKLTVATTIVTYSMPSLLSNNDIPPGTVYNGILFRTSSGLLKDNIEIVAAAGESTYFYAGSKK